MEEIIEKLNEAKLEVQTELANKQNLGIEGVIAERLKAIEESIRAEETAKYDDNCKLLSMQIQVIDTLIAKENAKIIEAEKVVENVEATENV